MVLFPVPQVATCPGTRLTNPAKSNQHLEATIKLSIGLKLKIQLMINELPRSPFHKNPRNIKEQTLMSLIEGQKYDEIYIESKPMKAATQITLD